MQKCLWHLRLFVFLAPHQALRWLHRGTPVLLSLIPGLSTNSWDNNGGQLLLLLVISYHFDFFLQALSGALLCFFFFLPVLTPKPFPSVFTALLWRLTGFCYSTGYISDSYRHAVEKSVTGHFILFMMLNSLSNKYFHLHLCWGRCRVFPLNNGADTENHWPVLPSKIASNPQFLPFFKKKMNVVFWPGRTGSYAMGNSGYSVDPAAIQPHHPRCFPCHLSPRTTCSTRRAQMEDEAFVKWGKTGTICTIAFPPKQTPANGDIEPSKSRHWWNIIVFYLWSFFYWLIL